MAEVQKDLGIQSFINIQWAVTVLLTGAGAQTEAPIPGETDYKKYNQK